MLKSIKFNRYDIATIVDTIVQVAGAALCVYGVGMIACGSYHKGEIRMVKELESAIHEISVTEQDDIFNDSFTNE